MTKRSIPKKPKTPFKHYSMFEWKTLCGIVAIKGEETLSDDTNCPVCLKEAIKQHYQLALLANRVLKGDKELFMD